MQKKVHNAFKHGQNAIGCDHPASHFADLNIESNTVVTKSDPKQPLLETITAANLMAKEFGEQRWAIKGILPEGLTVLSGPPKIGKSWMAYDLALAVAIGGIALGSFRAVRGKVLYLALEDNQRRMKERFKRFSEADRDSISTELFISCSVARWDEGGWLALKEWLDNSPDCSLVIIDTWGRFSPSPKAKMNAYENDTRFLGTLQRLAISRRIAVVAITHNRKQGSNDVVEQVTGSTGITGAADAIWILARGRGEGSGILHITGRDVEEQNIAVDFNKTNCRWTALGDAARYAVDTQRREILDALDEAGEAMGPKVLATVLGRKEPNVKNLLCKMFRSGQVGKSNRGKYFAIKPSDDFDYLEPETADEEDF